jgi:hypothetical protein
VEVARVVRTVEFLDVHADRQGRVLVVWNAEGFLWSARAEAGGAFGAPALVHPERVGKSERLVGSGAGHVLILGSIPMQWTPGRGWSRPAWHRGSEDGTALDDAGGVVFPDGARSRRQAAWTNDLRPRAGGEVHAGGSGNGDALAILWPPQASLAETFFASAGGAWQRLRPLRDPVRSKASGLRVLGAPTKGFLLHWEQEDPDRRRFWSLRFTPGVGWGKPEAVDRADDEQIGAGQILMDDVGRALAIWSATGSRGRGMLVVNRSDPASGWGTPEHVGFGDRVVALGAGGTVALACRGDVEDGGYVPFDAGDLKNMGRVYDPPGYVVRRGSAAEPGWEQPLEVPQRPGIAVDGKGNIVAVWRAASRPGGPVDRILAARLAR